MEGMPRLPMFTPDFRTIAAPLPSDFAVQIKGYILMHYHDDPLKYDSAISEIVNMRSKLEKILPDLETLNILKRYYAQLRLMKSRFPMEEGDVIRVPFSWQDKNKDMSDAPVFEDINYELVCVMYNIGAVHCAIAKNELRTDLDSIKSAFTHFQCAAFPFQQIRDSMNAYVYSLVDFDSSLLTFFINILLAQAQECLLEKGIMDHRKNTVIARLAVYLKDIYKQCREHINASGLNDMIPSSKYKEWLRTCDAKSEIYGAIAMLHLGQHSEDDNKMGLRVAYFNSALEHINAAMKVVEKDKRESLKEAVTFLNDIILEKQRNAKKENDFIYHERVPKSEELTLVEGVVMVKAIGFDPTDRSVAGPDLFAALLPGDVLNSISIYSEEKAKFKRTILETIAEKDKELEDYINSLQLEDLNIDDDSRVKELPEMLLERSAAFNSQPDAFPELLDKLHRVGGCAIEADHKISDLHNRLDSINSVHLKNDEGFLAIRKELNRISDHHMKARTNNAELQRALAAHSESLKILAMPLNELSRRLTDIRTRPADSLEGQQLKKMLDKTNEMRAQRCILLSKLNEDLQNDDITAKCLAEKNKNNQELYKKELKKHEGTAKLIAMNLAAQQNILNALTDANANFGDLRRKIVEENKSHMNQVLALTAAYDVYVDVSQKAEEGLKFYSTLFSLLRNLDEAVEAIESAYEEEKKEKEKEFLQKLEELTCSGKTDCQINNSANIANAGNECKAETDNKSLRLKDCLEYYRRNIARSQMCTSVSGETQSFPCPRLLSENQSCLPPSSQFTSNFNQSVPNPTLRITKDIQQYHTSFETETPSQQYTLRGQAYGGPSFVPPRALPTNIVPSASGNTTIQQCQPPRNPPTSLCQNSTDASILSASNHDQQGIIPFSPQETLCISGVPQFFSMTPTSSGSVVKQSAMVLSNTVPSNPQPFSVQPTFISPIATQFHPSLPGVNITTGIKTKNSVDENALNPLYPQSPPYFSLLPNKMFSDFAGNAVLTGSIPTLAKVDAIPPAHSFVYPQNSTSQTTVSPWHQPLGQPLGNVNFPKTHSSVTPSEIGRERSDLSSVSSSVPACVSYNANSIIKTEPTPVMDLMNAPLDGTLPQPLVPTHLNINESKRNSSSEQPVLLHSVSHIQSANTEELNSMQTAELSGTLPKSADSSLCTAVVQQPRPAAAVAPIVQVDCSVSSTNDSMLCITNVSSMSYAASAPSVQPKAMFPQTSWCAGCGNESSAEERNTNMREVMNPQTFNIGKSDPVRLEKRHMREQFRTEGTAAQLPPLDPADPINCIDAHYWLHKT